jgi:hypothetical protein
MTRSVPPTVFVLGTLIAALLVLRPSKSASPSSKAGRVLAYRSN